MMLSGMLLTLLVAQTQPDFMTEGFDDFVQSSPAALQARLEAQRARQDVRARLKKKKKLIQIETLDLGTTEIQLLPTWLRIQKRPEFPFSTTVRKHFGKELLDSAESVPLKTGRPPTKHRRPSSE